LITVSLNNHQFDALVSFTFNVGVGALQRSTLRSKVNRAEHEQVPTEFMRWVYAGGKRIIGLVRRRKAELELYLT
ncbi:MAG: lysozyme, partial [Rickettsiales bacterium]|nr:lysozyme [Rickettsiales bacterium]